jgi:hypothetical protein
MARRKSIKQLKASKPVSGRMPLKRWLMVYTVLILATAAVAGIVASRQTTTTLPDPIRAEQRTAVGFPLYYPSKLPESMEVDVNSLARIDNNIITLRVTDGRGSLGRAFTVTEQATPAGFNFETLYSSLSDKSSFDMPLGKATIGSIDNGKTRLASLVANEKTWILIQAPPSIHLDELKDVLEHLRVSD